MRATPTALALAALLAISPAFAETLSGPPADGLTEARLTEAQARDRIEFNGYTGVSDLRRDAQGVWHGRAARNGDPCDVSLNGRGEFEDLRELAALTMFDHETGEPRLATAPGPALAAGIVQVAH